MENLICFSEEINIEEMSVLNKKALFRPKSKILILVWDSIKTLQNIASSIFLFWFFALVIFLCILQNLIYSRDISISQCPLPR